jgi:hypothetical protein
VGLFFELDPETPFSALRLLEHCLEYIDDSSISSLHKPGGFHGNLEQVSQAIDDALFESSESEWIGDLLEVKPSSI